ncbi:MAG TPA: tetratricopeptide repeat protein [Chryseosolibacter sp.]|nr:tetratricopeptide repeat protein [Chryseosolibacter sp.]
MIRGICLVFLSLFLSTSLFSQKIPLINSGELLATSRENYDTGNYAKAAELLLQIPERDTNYVAMLPELALAYTADKQYDKALEVCSRALKKPGEFRAKLLKAEAVATDRKGDSQKGREMLTKAIAKYPFDLSLHYNLALSYFNNKEYEKATQLFFDILAVNPFHQGCHLHLAQISIMQGAKTHGMLSLGLYLGISNSDNSRLVLLNNFVDNQVADDGTIPGFASNGCEKLDQIIRSRISLDDKFKSQIPVKVPVIRQFETLFEQLGTLNGNSDDPWLKYYLPIYQVIKSENLMLPFIYHICSSSDIDAVRKWRSKNEKALNTFFEKVNNKLQEKRAKVSATMFGFAQPVSAWYDDKNLLDAIGEKSGEERDGKWVYFYDNAELMAEGQYVNGKKIGIWKYYTNEGSLKSVENHDKGDITLYHRNGNKREYFFLKDGATDGPVEIYFECGALKEKLLYTAGKRNGKGELYYADGKTDMTYQYVDDKATGEFISYYPNGKIYSRSLYKDDMLDGKYVSYYSNGRVVKEGQYLNGKFHGPWKYYHSNGVLESTGEYVNGVGVGEWLFYDARGDLYEKRIYNSEGGLHGDNTFFKNGKPYIIYTYKKDMLTRIISHDDQGKELARSGAENGTFAAKIYFTSGQLKSEGSYRKGKIHGTWKDYWRNGKLRNEYTYDNGSLQGKATEYYESGEKRYDLQYANNALHGYFVEYYEHGQIKQEGWFQDGNREQQWLAYYSDGTLDNDYFYVKGEVSGKAYHYGVDGKLTSTLDYDGERIRELEYFDQAGKLVSTSKDDGAKRIIETRYKSKKPRGSYPLNCGVYNGNVTQWFSNGNVFYSYTMLDGKRESDYVYNDLNGQVLYKGVYMNDERTGIWKTFEENGVLASEGRYMEGKQDSVWTFYYRNGKMSIRSNFLSDERHGVSAYFAPDGTPLLEKMFDLDDIVAYRVAGPNNSWSEWIPFKGNEKIEIKYPNGNIAYVEEYQDGLRHGVRKVFFPNGKLCEGFNYVKGNYEGPYEYYYPNGKVLEKGSYKFNELNGKVELFNEDGTPARIEEYKMSTRNGKTTLYSKGVKKEFTFWDGTTVD